MEPPSPGAPLAGRRVLVLGGCGFLGRHISAAFAAAGAGVVVVCRGTRGDPCTAGVRALRLDLAGAGVPELARLCADVDARVVVNASGKVWSGTERQMTDVNADLAGRLAEAVAGLPGRPRLVHLGSAYEYGPTSPGTPVCEEHPLVPMTAYGRTKLLGTRRVLRAAEERGLDGVVLRVSVVCGPGAPNTSLTGTVATQLAAGADELRLAPLRGYRDLVDVRDVAEAVLAAARAPAGALAGRAVNIGSGEAVSVRRVVDLLASLSGRRVRVVEEPGNGLTRSAAQWQALDISRAWRLLGWAPRRGLAESMRDLLTAVSGKEET